VKGPRQRFLLNLGKLSLPQEEWLLFAKRIDDLVRRQRNFFSSAEENLSELKMASLSPLDCSGD